MVGSDRSVVQLSLKGEFIKRFKSCKQASLEVGLSIGMISSVARNFGASEGSQTAKGFKWKYDEVVHENENWKEHSSGKLVSNLGRVKFPGRSASYGQHTEQSYLKSSVNKKQKMFVHRLVLETFEPRDDFESLMVDHIDGNRANNKLENLRWVTAKENAKNRKPRRELFQHCETCQCNK